jgi:hypothetical protein
VRGELFEGGADLVVLPCSVKGTISTATKISVEHFKLEKPESFSKPLKLGATTKSKVFPGITHSPARYYCYACSVFNDSSELNALENIGQELGKFTEQDSTIDIIQSPLLGTGAGKISKKDSVISLARGFKKTARINSTLQLFVSDHESEQELNKLLGSGVFTRLIDSVLLNPNLFGVGVNLKKIFRLEK